MNDIAPMRSGIDFKAEAYRDPWSVPLDQIDVSNPYLYSEDTWHGFFARLRRDDPVHFVDSPLLRSILVGDPLPGHHDRRHVAPDLLFGCRVWRHHAQGSAFSVPQGELYRDGPAADDDQRKIVAPIVAPPNLAKMSSTIRSGRFRILEDLPRGEVFDWAIASRSS